MLIELKNGMSIVSKLTIKIHLKLFKFFYIIVKLDKLF